MKTLYSLICEEIERRELDADKLAKLRFGVRSDEGEWKYLDANTEDIVSSTGNILRYC